MYSIISHFRVINIWVLRNEDILSGLSTFDATDCSRQWEWFLPGFLLNLRFEITDNRANHTRPSYYPRWFSVSFHRELKFKRNMRPMCGTAVLHNIASDVRSLKTAYFCEIEKQTWPLFNARRVDTDKDRKRNIPTNRTPFHIKRSNCTLW